MEIARQNPLSLISSSLEIIYCSTMLSNHDIIRLVRFVSKTKVGVVELVLSLIL
jgi:cell division ATPase FtsA